LAKKCKTVSLPVVSSQPKITNFPNIPISN